MRMTSTGYPCARMALLQCGVGEEKQGPGWDLFATTQSVGKPVLFSACFPPVRKHAVHNLQLSQEPQQMRPIIHPCFLLATVESRCEKKNASPHTFACMQTPKKPKATQKKNRWQQPIPPQRVRCFASQQVFFCFSLLFPPFLCVVLACCFFFFCFSLSFLCLYFFFLTTQQQPCERALLLFIFSTDHFSFTVSTLSISFPPFFPLNTHTTKQPTCAKSFTFRPASAVTRLVPSSGR